MPVHKTRKVVPNLGGKREEMRSGVKWAGGASKARLVGYKYEPGCVQVSSDLPPDTMTLLALLLMIGAVGKERDIHTDTYQNTHTHTQSHTCVL